MKWTKEKCQKEALKYKSRNEFCINSGSAYYKSLKNNWMNEICSHMNLLCKPNEYWTKEKCQKEALKYKSRMEYQINSNSSYRKALKEKWINEICSHMKNKNIKPKKYWTKEKCQEEALKYNTRLDFQKNKAYQAARKMNWLEEICSHMIEYHKQKGYWIKEKCAELASKCTYRNEFQQKYKIAYNTSLKNNWLDEICSHMKPCGNLNKRLIYAFIFSDNKVYIGLTCNIIRRKNEHLNKQRKNTSVYKYILETNITPKLIELTDYIDVNEAIKMEKYYIETYIKEGYKLLNKNRGGTIGYSKNINNWDYNTHKRKK